MSSLKRSSALVLLNTRKLFFANITNVFRGHLIGYYISICFVFFLADALLSYVSPIFIEEHVSSSLVMGLVMAFSSVVGFCCDILFSQWFKHKTYLFFLKATVATALLFPLFWWFLPSHIMTFLLGMAVWGVYYEFSLFSNFTFLNRHVTLANHAQAWGNLHQFQAIAYAVGPFLAGFIISKNETFIFPAVIVLLLLVGLGTTILTSLEKNHQHVHPAVTTKKGSGSFRQELKIWRVLLKKVFPLYIFLIAIFMIDSTFWTIGALLSEELRQTSWIGGLLLASYTVPSLLFGVLAGRASRPFGKKKMAFITGILTGVFLGISGFIAETWLLLLFVFLASAFFAITLPEIYATFEDYVSRLHEFGTDMIGIQGSARSMSYVIGPIAAGVIDTFVGHRLTFSIMGGFLALVSLIMLVVVPKKIAMPQQELLKTASEDSSDIG